LTPVFFVVCSRNSKLKGDAQLRECNCGAPTDRIARMFPYPIYYANVRNAKGPYVTPRIVSVTAATGVKLAKNTDYRLSIVNASGKHSFPIFS
jgi:hypothetical protein